METYRIENLTFSYPSRNVPALDGINLTVGRGAFITLCGPSGCGKTTILRQLKPTCAPHGTKTGAIFFEGMPLEELSARDAAAKIGFVFQSPENQIVTDKVWHELAFGPESLGLAQAEIRLRVAETASFFGIQNWFHKSVTELSGGQKQLLALASTMVMQPSILILDEPTSQLDPIAAGEFLAMVKKINQELGTTVILTEHRLEEVFPMSSCAVLMDKGQIIAEGHPQNIGPVLPYHAMPTPTRVWTACSNKEGKCPVTVKEGVVWLSGMMQALNKENFAAPDTAIQTHVHMPDTGHHKHLKKVNQNFNSKIAISLKDVWFRYEKNLPDVLKGLSFVGHYGEIVAILGGNGTGKTTALSVIAGLNKPYRGTVRAEAQVYALPQNPQSLFVAKTVKEDLLEVSDKNSDAIIELCQLEDLLDSHPYDLSGGEQQRAALAKVLLLEPEILLLDEPTKGLDGEYKQIFAGILRKLAEEGTAIVIVSHDIEFCAEWANRCALFFDGDIVAENTPGEFFSGNSFYTTGANRMARHILPDAITANDIISALGGRIPPKTIPHKITETAHEDILPSAPPLPAYSKSLDTKGLSAEILNTKGLNVKTADKAAYKGINSENTLMSPKALPKRTIMAAAMILLTIPLTIYAGIYFLDDRQFYIISMLIILQTMLPFALIFEGRKPQAKELVLIAVLCGIAVAGRAVFFMVPQFKPVVALVIIAGVALGGEAGFLVGAITGFVSNMFFGQGPWTPWQMFAFGIIGFLAGILFRRGVISRTPVSLSTFGGLAAFVIYGGIMTPATVLIFQPNPTFEMFVIAFLNSIPFDLIHAVGTVIFLTLISRPMLEKLDRIKVKYGLCE